ncbi:MAG TPA: zf-HC2 domain-containing protein [Candidatus Sulfotelmatobacter sp.]|nr:zf-HC2 domain-containing protein [Candidatus Sulfotelmatobacter sp.]
MPDQTRNGLQCNEFELLLTDALDGVLSGVGLERFEAHARSCATCGPLLAEAEAGRSWLKGLTEVEPPASLVANILASTTGVDTQRLRSTARAGQPRISWLEHVRAAVLEPVWAAVRQPRFAMSFGMAFFAFSVALTMAGVKPSDLKQISLRPSAIRLTYYRTQARVVRYYDNVKLVYEVQAAFHGIKRDLNPPAEPATKKDHKNDTTQQPEQKQERNYSQRDQQDYLAGAQSPSEFDPSNPDLPVVSVTTYRRLV